MRSLLALLLTICHLVLIAQVSAFKQGDIIFHTSLSDQSLAVQRATNSKYSHMGLIWLINEKAYVYEASSTVKLTPVTEWINRGEEKHFVVKRLKQADNVFTSQSLATMEQAAGKYRGLPYDLTFEWSDEKIYCSELVWKIYRDALKIELAQTQKLREFNLTDPAVQEKMRQRYGTNVPLEEPVISPQAIYESPHLVTVHTD